jgi:hypothetical protein
MARYNTGSASAQPPRLVWYRLFNLNGEPYKDSSLKSINFSDSYPVVKFRKSLKAANAVTLAPFIGSQLKVYMNETSYEQMGKHLNSSVTLVGLGMSKEDALYVLVPTYLSHSAQSFIQSMQAQVPVVAPIARTVTLRTPSATPVTVRAPVPSVTVRAPAPSVTAPTPATIVRTPAARQVPHTTTAVRAPAPAASPTTHPLRLARWTKLTLNLSGDKDSRKRKADDSDTQYYASFWGKIGHTFEADTQFYSQPVTPIPEENLLFLSKYLAMVSQCYNGLSLMLGNAGKRLHLITPIIMAVVSLFPDCLLEVDSDYNVSTRFDCKLHFEFVLYLPKKRVYILQAKDDMFKEGISQTLLGCEMAHDIDGSSAASGIITNF